LAFAWSERLRTPVIVLSDKEVGVTLESVDMATLPRPPMPERAPFRGDGRFIPYECDCPEEPPLFAPVGGKTRVVATGSAHDREGRLRKNAPEVIDVLLHLQAKVESHAEEMAVVSADLLDGADTLVMSYGISARAARQACHRLRAAGKRISFLQLKTLFPLPASAIRQAAAESSRVVVVEENMNGLYASVVEPLLGGRTLIRVNRVGDLVTPGQIVAAIQRP
jgi:2-oxoglutarate ferredoxin oxidoreductase subunit alpha